MAKLIVGCGYLGRRVGRIWLRQGDLVYAVTRSQVRADELAAEGFLPIVGDITKPETLVSLPSVTTVLFAVGMDRTVYSDIEWVYVQGLRNFLERLTVAPAQLIYISTTGVYGEFDGAWVDEDAPTQPLRPGGKACVKAEQLLRDSPLASRVTILRFAGIYGDARVPTRQKIESGQWRQVATGGFLNLIHVDDGAAIVATVAQQQASGQTYIVSDGHPVLRGEYYQYIAELLGVAAVNPEEPQPADAPTVAATVRGGSSKRVSNQKLVRWLDGFEFQYPNYRFGLQQALKH